MKDQLIYKGYWHLPELPDKIIAGVLIYTPRKSIVLELMGAFDSGDNLLEVFVNKKREGVIHGFTSDAKKITLIECVPWGSANLNSFPLVKYSCQFLIIGKHISSLDDSSFQEAYVKFPILSFWCHPGALRTVYKFDSKEKIKSMSISFDSYKDTDEDTINRAVIDENTELLLKRGVNYDSSYSRLEPKICQSTFLVIRKGDDSSVNDFISNIYLYEQFLSLSTLRPIECKSVVLYDKECYQELKDGEKFHFPIELIYVQRGNSTEVAEEPRYFDFLFTYDTVKDEYSKIIRKWFTDDKNIIPIRRHLIESIKPKTVFSSVDFLIVMQALEGFAKRFRKGKIQAEKANKPTLNEIIKGLRLEFSCIDKLKNDVIDVDGVVNSRHYYSHFMERSEMKGVLDGIELYALTHKLRKLLICCVLHFIGFDYHHINDIFNNSDSHLLQTNV
jgi:hypothetical protein